MNQLIKATITRPKEVAGALSTAGLFLMLMKNPDIITFVVAIGLYTVIIISKPYGE